MKPKSSHNVLHAKNGAITSKSLAGSALSQSVTGKMLGSKSTDRARAYMAKTHASFAHDLSTSSAEQARGPLAGRVIKK